MIAFAPAPRAYFACFRTVTVRERQRSVRDRQIAVEFLKTGFVRLNSRTTITKMTPSAIPFTTIENNLKRLSMLALTSHRLLRRKRFLPTRVIDRKSTRL